MKDKSIKIIFGKTKVINNEGGMPSYATIDYSYKLIHIPNKEYENKNFRVKVSWQALSKLNIDKKDYVNIENTLIEYVLKEIKKGLVNDVNNNELNISEKDIINFDKQIPKVEGYEVEFTYLVEN